MKTLTHTALIALSLVALSASAALARTVRVTEQRATDAKIYLSSSAPAQENKELQEVTFEEESQPSSANVVRTYLSFKVDGVEQLSAPATVLIKGAPGSERSYQAFSGVTQRVKDHLEEDLKENHFLPLLRTIPSKADSFWEIPTELASNLLEQPSEKLLSKSVARGMLRTRDDEGVDRRGADFRFDLHLSALTYSGLRLADSSRIQAQVRLEPTDAGLLVVLQSSLEGRPVSINGQALPTNARLSSTTHYRRTYTEVDELGAPLELSRSQKKLSKLFSSFLGRAANKVKKEGITRQFGRRRR